MRKLTLSVALGTACCFAVPTWAAVSERPAREPTRVAMDDEPNAGVVVALAPSKPEERKKDEPDRPRRDEPPAGPRREGPPPDADRHRAMHEAVERLVGPEKARQLHELFERLRAEHPFARGERPDPEQIRRRMEEIQEQVRRIVGPEKAAQLREIFAHRFGPPGPEGRRPMPPMARREDDKKPDARRPEGDRERRPEGDRREPESRRPVYVESRDRPDRREAADRCPECEKLERQRERGCPECREQRARREQRGCPECREREARRGHEDCPVCRGDARRRHEGERDRDDDRMRRRPDRPEYGPPHGEVPPPIADLSRKLDRLIEAVEALNRNLKK